MNEICPKCGSIAELLCSRDTTEDSDWFCECCQCQICGYVFDSFDGNPPYNCEEYKYREKYLKFCPRCGEPIKPDSPILSESEIAEIEDKDGKVLIVHVNCMKSTDKIA